MNSLKLTLKKQWFDLIEQGEKKEEYRKVKSYWFERLVNQHEQTFKNFTGVSYKEKANVATGISFVLSEDKGEAIEMKQFDSIEFTNGYSGKSPKITLECKGVEIRSGNSKWGAVENEKYFVIKLGREISRQNC